MKFLEWLKDLLLRIDRYFIDDIKPEYNKCGCKECDCPIPTMSDICKMCQQDCHETSN